MLDQVGNLVVGPTFVERVFRPGRRSFLDHRLINYCDGLQVALLAEEDAGDEDVDVVVESKAALKPTLNK
jgi:hypothetical protein